jgi:nitroreductase
MTQSETGIIAAILARRSIRAYRADQPVEHEKIVQLLQAAMAAPSACNLQPWEFIIVTEQETVRLIKESVAENGGYNAPLVIIVCSDPALIPWDNDDGVVDCSAAVENMLIAATALGLGSVWIGGFEAAPIRGILGIPEQIRVKALVYFGYPAEEKEPRTKYLEEAVYWQKYDPERVHHPRPGNIFA